MTKITSLHENFHGVAVEFKKQRNQNAAKTHYELHRIIKMPQKIILGLGH